MQVSTWFNRGTVLGSCVGLVFGAGVPLAWFLLRPTPTASAAELSNTERGPVPPPLATRRLTEAELADLADQIKKLEQLAKVLSEEIEAGEKQIELLGRANRTAEQDNGKRRAMLQQRHSDASMEYNRAGRELLRLEAELIVLKKQLADAATTEPNPILVRELLEKDPRVVKAKALLSEKEAALWTELSRSYLNNTPILIELAAEVAKAKPAYDEAVKIAKPAAIEAARKLDTAIKKERIAKLDSLIAVKKEEREKLKEERDALKKLIDVGVGGGLNIQAMRDALKPQKETLDKCVRVLALLRLEQKLKIKLEEAQK